MMALRKVLLSFVLGTFGFAVVSNCEQFCRQCTSARHLDDCTKSIICGSNERCYTEEVITPTGIVYNAGCLAYDACRTHHSIGKRQGSSDHLVACARCCLGGAKNETNHDCNAKLCGLPGTATKGTENLSRCYKCEKAHSLEDCNEFTICQDNEICFSETHRVGLGGIYNGTAEFYFGCARKDICVVGTKRILEIYDHMATGKREQTGCKACCGGDFCNTADCGTLLHKMYSLSKTGHLDFASLTYKQ